MLSTLAIGMFKYCTIQLALNKMHLNQSFPKCFKLFKQNKLESLKSKFTCQILERKLPNFFLPA